jgi:hypothetical protein
LASCFLATRRTTVAIEFVASAVPFTSIEASRPSATAREAAFSAAECIELTSVAAELSEVAKRSHDSGLMMA